jgi:hypothetical protein
MRRWLEADPSRKLVWITHHEEEPIEMGLDYRLYVGSTRCIWQRRENGGEGPAWVNEAA